MGRKPRELTMEMVDTLAELRGSGVSIPESCRRAGIGVSVYYRWVREAEEWQRLKRMKELGLFDFDAQEQAEYDAWFAERKAAA